ncbi:hypothetical protein PsYK624_053520 [Phanerochaete sordida]|uniref:Uncharacterized protein n=1 Tax=Phanerochaete sordida TaxID=48140 RepID=A0A9P3G6N2_9APHY|nr:hypothetical protein PsYK624_053520 [Phanerochaete sordida]
MAPKNWKRGDEALGCLPGKQIVVKLLNDGDIEKINGKSYKVYVGEWTSADNMTIRHSFIPDLHNDLLPIRDPSSSRAA